MGILRKSAPDKNKKKIIFLVGPTAIGKSEIAVKLARKIGAAEIVSCDSMQIYKGMGIITSQPGPVLTKQVTHHLLGIIPPEIEYNVWKYRQAGVRKIKEIIKKGKIPLFVGGTGLYMSILIDGLFKAPPVKKEIRKRLWEEEGLRGSKFLHERLSKVDPEAAKKIHPNDAKRVIRALEVFEASGIPISLRQKEREGLTEDYRVDIFCLDMDREKLYKRIDNRVEKMFSQGLIQEVKRLLKLKLSKTASFAIGLRELRDYFDGALGLALAKEMMKRNSRQYAKRQLTWFRRDRRIKWIKIKEGQTSEAIAAKIWRKFS